MTVKIEDSTASQIAGRDIYNINGSEPNNDNRLLVLAQRKAIHDLVSDIESYGELAARDVWLKIHALVGVTSINEITVCQYEKITTFLQGEFEAAAERAACNMLIHFILIETKSNDELKNMMKLYSKKQFGTSDLKRLKKTQLQNVLNYVEELSNLQKLNSQSLYNQVITLIKTQTKPTLAIFAVGFILGAIIF